MPSMGGGGGAIFISKSFSIINCTFTNCKATTGGAIYSRRSKHSTIKKSKIKYLNVYLIRYYCFKLNET